MNNTIQKMPLPSTQLDWANARKGTLNRTLNDHVEDIHMKLSGDEKYLGYLEAVHDSETVEGSVATDNTFAAQMIRAKAIEVGDFKVSRLKAHTIVKCLTVVLRRYGLSRKERARTIGGEIMPPEANGQNGE
jgi:hypothetical protein